MKRQQSKRFFMALFVNFTLLVIGILVAEIFFGNWFYPDNLNRLNIIRSRTVKYDIAGLYDSSSKAISITRDQYGLRGAFQLPADIDILTVGGSTTDQRYITDGKTWQDVLQQKFESIGKNVKVANAGVDGQSTFGHIKNFDWWFPEMDPSFWTVR